MMSFSYFCFYDALRYLHSFPTRRSSDLTGFLQESPVHEAIPVRPHHHHDLSRGRRRARSAHAPRQPERRADAGGDRLSPEDRKSTRLNSSHLVISYAVFCLKKKKNITQI